MGPEYQSLWMAEGGAGCGWLAFIALAAGGVAWLLFANDALPIGGPRARWGASAALWACLGLVGLGAAYSALGFLIRRIRERLQPATPWLWDHDWDPAGASYSALNAGCSTLTFTGLFALLLVPALFIIEDSDFGELLGLPTVALFAIFAFLGLRKAATLLGRSFKYGSSRLRFSNFPFRLGGRLEAVLEEPGLGDDGTPIKATLRCVRMAVEKSGDSSGIVYNELFADSMVAPVKSGAAIISMPIPVDSPPTRLGRAPALYWELLVTGAPGSDYRARFLLPIYGP